MNLLIVVPLAAKLITKLYFPSNALKLIVSYFAELWIWGRFQRLFVNRPTRPFQQIGRSMTYIAIPAFMYFQASLKDRFLVQRYFQISQKTLLATIPSA